MLPASEGRRPGEVSATRVGDLACERDSRCRQQWTTHAYCHPPIAASKQTAALCIAGPHRLRGRRGRHSLCISCTMVTHMKSAHTKYQSLLGRRIVITGGTTGLGRAIALRLSAEGASVLIFGRHKPELDDAMRDIAASGFAPIGIVADVTLKADVDRVFARVDEEWDGMDVLVNNAAVGAGSLEEETEEACEYAVMTNVSGYLLCAKRALERMKPNAHIVLVGSISADRRNPGGSVYVATKSAIQGFAESFRQEAAVKGIKVSLVEPGKTGSDMIDQDLDEQRESQEKLEMLKAEDIAVAVEYILTQPARCTVSDLKIVPTKAPDA